MQVLSRTTRTDLVRILEKNYSCGILGREAAQTLVVAAIAAPLERHRARRQARRHHAHRSVATSPGYATSATPSKRKRAATGAINSDGGGALPPLLLTDDEAVAVAVGLRAAASGGVAGYDEAAVAALAKLEQVLPSRVRESVRALGTATMLLPTRGETVDTEVLLSAAQGCRRNERMRFEYRDNSGNITAPPCRTVRPGQR